MFWGQATGHFSNEVTRSVVYYALCSSVMLVVNKVTISQIPLPACVFFVQFVATSAFCLISKWMGWIEVDDLRWETVRRFILYVCVFVLSIYFNGKVLQQCNIETLITFRSCCPLCVSILDWAFLGRELPSTRSFGALLGVLTGAIGYVLCDSEFQVHGFAAYGWVSMYTVVIIFEMTYAKLTISTVEFKSRVWGSVLYTNTIALVPIGFLAFSSGELAKLPDVRLHYGSGLALVLCSCLGIGMNWSGWNCRNNISAAAYTLLGVACKMISILLNILIWEKHASQRGISWLVLCLISSSLYHQAPLRVRTTSTMEECKVTESAIDCGSQLTAGKPSALPPATIVGKR